jgi:hypothetical protein
MLRIAVLIPLLVGVGCAVPDKLTKRNLRGISNISIAVNTTIVNDVGGFTDSIDIPFNKTMAERLLASIESTLTQKGFRLVDRHLSIGRAYSREKFYVVAADSERTRDTNELEAKPGPYFSDRLKPEQLNTLYKSIEDNEAIPQLADMGFRGDAILVALVNGRLIGIDKSVGAYVTNAAIITLFIAGGGGSFGGSPELVDTDDTYLVQLRMYSTKDVGILWQSDIKTHSIEDALEETANLIETRISAKH